MAYGLHLQLGNKWFVVYSFSELHDLENMAYEIHLQLSRELMCVEKNTTITSSMSSFAHMFAFKILIGK